MVSPQYLAPSANNNKSEHQNKNEDEDMNMNTTFENLSEKLTKSMTGVDSLKTTEDGDSYISKVNVITHKQQFASDEKPVYESKWASSHMSNAVEFSPQKGEKGMNNDSMNLQLSTDEELPIFANDECRRLHQLTKQLENESDEAAKAIKENKDRISIMREHLHDVRQEIDSTNALFAAKNKEIATEKHLIALDERERAAIVAEMKLTDSTMSNEKERLRAMQNQIHILIDEREKLKLDLNWNQEELEQWATAAAKKEGDTLALEKYTRADEVKIKELTLRLENMTKKSVDKRAELENEIAENRAKKLEVERLARTFREQHEERRLLVNQWQETVNAMRDRDLQINDISNKYVDAQQELEIQRSILAEKKEALENLKAENEVLNQEIETADRVVQSKRQENISAQQNLQIFHDEMEAMKLEGIASSTSLDRMKNTYKVTKLKVMEKAQQLDVLKAKYDKVKLQLKEESTITTSKEKFTQIVELRLKEREKELRLAENNVKNLKEKMFKDSQMLAQLRQKESNLISEIRSTQATAKNLTAKLKQLEQQQTKQHELLYNAEFQLQQMERKVARGLGERSDEEKKQLQKQIQELEQEARMHQDRETTLTMQGKKLHQELQKWEKKKGLCEKDQTHLNEMIVDVELEIVACELNLKQLNAKKEEEMVSHDLVSLEVRKLRDVLRAKVEKVVALEMQRENLVNEMTSKKAEIQILQDVKIAQLRAVEDERHKSKVELGRRKIAAEKTKLKYDSLSKRKEGDDHEDEENSPVYHLIVAAQKRAELQREGDLLDNEIRKKEAELKSMHKTLSHLRQRNTSFRSSFANVDKRGKDFKDIETTEDEIKSSEKILLEAKKEVSMLQRNYTLNTRKIQKSQAKLCICEEEHIALHETKARVVKEVDKFANDLENICTKIEEESKKHRTRDALHSNTNRDEKSLQELLFQAEMEESQTEQIIDMLLEISREFPDIKESILSRLFEENITIEVNSH